MIKKLFKKGGPMSEETKEEIKNEKVDEEVTEELTAVSYTHSPSPRD